MTRLTHQHASLMQARLPPLMLLATCLEAGEWSGGPASLPYADAGLAALALLPPGSEVLGLRYLTCIFRRRQLLEWLRASANTILEALQQQGGPWAWLAMHSPGFVDEVWATSQNFALQCVWSALECLKCLECVWSVFNFYYITGVSGFQEAH
jgi:hypothetical protein